MSVPGVPQGPVPAIGIPNSEDIPRLVYCAPYFTVVPLAELIEPAVTEAVEAQLPSLVPPYVSDAANNAVQQLAVLLTGSTMSGPLFLNPVMPTQPSQAASMAYVDSMVATAGIPEVPPTPIGQAWARETGQWVPVAEAQGTFLPLTGGTMQGAINMGGNSINALASVPTMPNGAAPAQWVLNQIASVSLYQGTWDMDTYVPDLTQSSTHINGYTWIAITTSASGVVITPAIPGLQGTTVFNGDTVIYSASQGTFTAIHAGGLSLPEAQSLFVQLAGSTMTGPLILSGNATQPMQSTPLQQVQSLIASAVFPEPPGDGQTYGRNGLQLAWLPVLSTAGGVLTGTLTLSGNVSGALMAVPYGQVQSMITAGTAGYVLLSGSTMTGTLTAPSVVAQNSASVGGSLGIGTAGPLTVGGQGINYTAIGTPGQNIAWGVSSGAIQCYQAGAAVGGALVTVAGATMTGALNLSGNAPATAPLQAVPLQQVEGLSSANIGRNYIHNPMFSVNQRGQSSYVGVVGSTYTFDRWWLQLLAAGDSGTVTVAAASDADRTAIGDENAENYASLGFTGGSGAGNQIAFIERIEDVRRLSNKTVTLSFWAYSPTSLKIGMSYVQNFGSGGSPSAGVLANIGVATLTTGWQRFSYTFTFPSTAGKTFGTTANTSYAQVTLWLSCPSASSNYALSGNLGAQSGTINIWGVQLELGSVATPFEHRDPEIELDLCRRFYQPSYSLLFAAYGTAGQVAQTTAPCTPTMRASPTVTISSMANTNLSASPAMNSNIYQFWNIASSLTVVATGVFGINMTITLSADL